MGSEMIVRSVGRKGPRRKSVLIVSRMRKVVLVFDHPGTGKRDNHAEYTVLGGYFVGGKYAVEDHSNGVKYAWDSVGELDKGTE